GYGAIVLISSEVENPQRTLPRAMIFGVVAVALLYLLVNIVFLSVLPPEQMVTESGGALTDLGAVTAGHLFGDKVAGVFDLVFVILVLSTLSAVIQVGARVAWAMAKRGDLPAPMSKLNGKGAPANCLLLQAVILLSLTLFFEEQQLLILNGLVVLLITAPTALALFVLRKREPDLERPFRVPWYPWVPLVNLALSLTIAVSLFLWRDWRYALWSAGLVLVLWALRPLLQQRTETDKKGATG
ncbi:MAG: APC family permease, partial [Planctomycetota bacterium]